MKCGVALGVRILSLVDDQVQLGAIQRRMQLCPARSLNAVHGPDTGRVNALPAGGIHLHAFERAVVGRMPIAGCNHELESVRDRVDRSGDLVAALDRQRPAGSEVVLEVDDQQSVHPTYIRSAMTAPNDHARRVGDLLLSLEALDSFEASPLGQRFPTVVAAWRRAWTQVVPFLAFAPAVRRVIYTTNIVENVHRQLRKIIKTRGHFPNDDAAMKLLWLALRNITLKWVGRMSGWPAAMNQFAVLYGERFTSAR